MKTGIIIVFVAIFVIGLQNCILAASISSSRKTSCTDDLLESRHQKGFGRSFRGTPYVAEITRKFLRLQTLGCEPLEIELTAGESEEIQKLSYDFIKLLDSSKISSPDEAEVLNWKDLNPIIVLTNSEITIRFAKTFRDSSSTHEPDKRSVYWKFLTEYARNVFRYKLKELNVTAADGEYDTQFDENDSEDDFSSFKNFVDTLWKIVKISISYAEDNVKEWTAAASAVTKAVPKATTPVAMKPATLTGLPIRKASATTPTPTASSPNFNSTSI